MFELRVTFEAGESFKALLSGLVKPAFAVESPKNENPADKPAATAKQEKPAVPAKTAVTAKSEKPAMPAKPEKPAEPEFSELDNDAKLELIKAEVTKHTKNRKGADVKWLLAQFNAASVSKTDPLSPDDYDSFYECLVRYGKGEKLADMFPGDDDLD